MPFDNNPQHRLHDNSVPHSYRRAIIVSTICLALFVALVFAGMFSFNGPNWGKPWCYGNGYPIFSGIGFAFLVLSLLSAAIAFFEAKKSRGGAVVCLIMSLLGFPLFGFYIFLVAFGCAG